MRCGRAVLLISLALLGVLACNLFTPESVDLPTGLPVTTSPEGSPRLTLPPPLAPDGTEKATPGPSLVPEGTEMPVPEPPEARSAPHTAAKEKGT